MIDERRYEQLQRNIFGDGSRPVFAVLDGAVIPDLPARLACEAPGALCLFSGELEPTLAAAAPYLVPLNPWTDASRMVLHEGWNAHWGIVLVADSDTTAQQLRSHLRCVLRARARDGSPMLFRYYDPRVFRSVVSTFSFQQRGEFFGPIQHCFIEGDGNGALIFARDAGPMPAQLALAAAA